jgi:hypothetical protein
MRPLDPMSAAVVREEPEPSLKEQFQAIMADGSMEQIQVVKSVLGTIYSQVQNKRGKR